MYHIGVTAGFGTWLQFYGSFDPLGRNVAFKLALKGCETIPAQVRTREHYDLEKAWRTSGMAPQMHKTIAVFSGPES